MMADQLIGTVTAIDGNATVVHSGVAAGILHPEAHDFPQLVRKAALLTIPIRMACRASPSCRTSQAVVPWGDQRAAVPHAARRPRYQQWF